MREIKFRAWHKKRKLMYGVQALHWYEWLSAEPGLDHMDLQDEDTRSKMVGTNVELMLFTGREDKNGMEIFEGDILQWCPRDSPPSFVFHVEWDSERARYYTPDGGAVSVDQWGIHCAVIGNIYENPELLAGKP